MSEADGRPDEVERDVIVVKGDPIARAWLRETLRETAFRVVAEAATVEDAFAAVAAHPADVLLVARQVEQREYLFDEDATRLGTDLVAQLRRDGWPTPALLMASAPWPGLNARAREAGMQGTVMFTADPERLVGAMRVVAQGGKSFDPLFDSRRRDN